MIFIHTFESWLVPAAVSRVLGSGLLQQSDADKHHVNMDHNLHLSFTCTQTHTDTAVRPRPVPASTDARWHSSLTSPFSYSFGSSLSWDMRWAFVESFAPFSLSLAGPIISALRWAYFLTGLRHNKSALSHQWAEAARFYQGQIFKSRR